MNRLFIFDKDRALKADDGGYIIKGGVYVGVITKMTAFTKDSGSGGFELSLETISGQKCDYVQIYTRNKDGSENFAKSKIDSILGIFGLEEIDAVKIGDNYEFPKVYKKRIGFALQREDYLREDHTIGWKMNLLHFFFPDTMQTFREYMEGSGPNTSEIIVNDIRIDESNARSKNSHTTGETGTAYNPEDDDLPF